TRARFVIRIAKPRLIITRRLMKKEEERWDEGNHTAEEEGNPMKVVAVVVKEELIGIVLSADCRVTVSSSARRMMGSV
ncbi:hypothetical protein A2U01_0082254, partial [Trifolium medium]|nr:hypothetical protein [Trifolium medium]